MSTYQIEGNKYASVTTIISDCTDKSGALTQWAANSTVLWLREHSQTDPTGLIRMVSDEDLEAARFNFRDISKDALDIGSEVHEAIQTYLKTGKEPQDPIDEVLSAFIAFLEFKDEHDMQTEKTEFTVYDSQLKWAGTLDWIGMFDGKRTVLDWKTNKGKIYKESHYQIAAYRSADPWVESCGCVRIDKESGYADYKCTDKSYLDDLNVFQKMCALYYARHPRIRKGAGL